MPTPHLSLPRPAAAVADPSALDRLPPAGASHDDVRRYSRARRNLLPRADHVTAVAGGWAHEVVLAQRRDRRGRRSGARGSGRHPALEATAAAVAARARRAVRISERTLARIHPGLTAPALLSGGPAAALAAVAAADRARAGWCSSPTASSTPATSAP